MAEQKTKPTKGSVDKFLKSAADEQKRKDCYTLLKLMKKITKQDAVMWGPAIVGFGNFHFKSASGREGDWFYTGFSPRKAALTIYLVGGLGKSGALLKKLGKHKTGGGCVYVKTLNDIDLKVLEELIKAAIKFVNETYVKAKAKNEE